MPPRKHRPLAEIRAFSKRMWLFIIITSALFFLWKRTTTYSQQLDDETVEIEKSRKPHEQSPSRDKQPVEAVCGLSKGHADFFLTLSLDPLADDFNPLRMGVDQHHEGIGAIRRAYRDFENGKAEWARDVPKAAFALLDETYLRIFVGWVEEKPGGGWTVDWRSTAVQNSINI